MSTFIDILDNIKGCAVNIAKRYDFKFEPDELVNEAWIRNHLAEQEYIDPPLVMRRAKLDMYDYLRSQTCKRQSWVVKGIKKERKHIRPKVFTNSSLGDNNGEHELHLFDKPFVDKSLLRLENDNLTST